MLGCRSRHWLLSAGVLVVIGCLVCSSLAGAEEIESDDRRVTARVSPNGLSVYRSEKWGLLNLSLVNPTDAPIELLTATFFTDEPALQYGRHTWLPPKSQLQTWHPVFLPRVASGSAKSIGLRTLVMDARQQREVLIRDDSGSLQLDGALRVTDDSSVTGMIEAAEGFQDGIHLFPNEDDNAVSELVMAARLRTDHTRRLFSLRDRQVSSGEESLQALDQLVIRDSGIANDDVGLSAIRRWLFGGGHLWVMLDRMEPRFLERLLGDEFVCQMVDRVGLTTIHMETTATGASSTQEYEQPVEFVRVAVSDVNVACTVDGWPAAFTKTCGDGRLLVTTLGPRGWMRRRTAADNAPAPNPGQSSRESGPNAAAAKAQDEFYQPTGFVPLDPMANLAFEFFEARPARLLPEAVLEPLSQEYVGFSIPSRGLIIGLLLGFIALLIGLGTWLWRQSRLELLGAIGPGLAVAISVILVLMGQHRRNAIPPTVANIQFVQPIPGTDDIRITGVSGLFSPEAGTATINAHRGGWLLPDASGFQSTTRRMVWTDLEDWSWEHVPQAAGAIRSATFQTAAEHSDRLEARATFGPEGLTGRLHVPGGHRPADAVLATRFGRIGVELRGDDTIVARADHVFAADQFLAAGLLSDEQNRRRRMLEHLLMNSNRPDFPDVPRLFFWTDPWNIGFQFDEKQRSLGMALMSVPLNLVRPATGTSVTIAPPLLSYRGALGPDGSSPTGWWDNQRRQWIEKSRPSETWLRFQIPTVLLPVTVESARIQVKVRGPIGKLAIAGHRQTDNSIVPLKTWTDPVGTLTLEVADHELFNVSADGGLLLRVTGGDADRPELTQQEASDNSSMSFWQIESLTLELKVKTTDPN